MLSTSLVRMTQSALLSSHLDVQLYYRPCPPAALQGQVGVLPHKTSQLVACSLGGGVLQPFLHSADAGQQCASYGACMALSFKLLACQQSSS